MNFLDKIEGEQMAMLFCPPDLPSCWQYCFGADWYKVEHYHPNILDLLTWE